MSVVNGRQASPVDPGSPSRGERARQLSPQGRALAEELARVGDFRSAQEIHAALRERGERVGLATVYRHLNLLAELGAVDTLQTPGGETLYRHCAVEDHHHHLVCRTCGKTVEFEGIPEIEAWAERIAKRAGFADVSHVVEVFGTCPQCAAAAAARRPAR